VSYSLRMAHRAMTPLSTLRSGASDSLELGRDAREAQQRPERLDHHGSLPLPLVEGCPGGPETKGFLG
jgi:hypothetical protein